MDLKRYIETAWKGKWIIITVFATNMVIVSIFNYSTTSIYEATVTLRVLTTSSGMGSDTRYDIQYADRLLETYVRITTSGLVIGELQQRLDLDTAPKIKAEIIRSTELMTVSAESDDPALAADVANTLADILIEQSRKLHSAETGTASDTLMQRLQLLEEETKELQQEYEQAVFQTPGDSARLDALKQSIALKEELYGNLLIQYEDMRLLETMREQAVYVIEPATVPGSPTHPNTRLNLILGAIVSLVGGICLALFIDSLDTRLDTTDQIKALTGLPLLGSVPSASMKQETRRFDVHSPFAEAFRHVRARTLVPGAQEKQDILLVTSAEPQEGKSTVVANLAVAVARSAQNVVVIDADPYLSTLHEIFGVPNDKGLTDLLGNTADLDEVLQSSHIPHLQLITGGALSPEGIESIDPAKMDSLFQQLKQRCDLILVDTPAFLAMAEAALLVPLASGVLLVVSRGLTRREALSATCEQLTALGAKVLGVIVNRVDQKIYYQYHSRSKSTEKPNLEPTSAHSSTEKT